MNTRLTLVGDIVLCGRSGGGCGVCGRAGHEGRQRAMATTAGLARSGERLRTKMEAHPTVIEC
jgi:hypothetical protein